jgi:hypothetical protein
MRIAILGSGGVGGYFGAPTSTTRPHSSRCHVTTPDPCAMIPRRVFLDAAALLPLATDNAFYEPRGVLHSVPANTSPVNPARFLAIVVAQKGAPITVTP